MTSCPGYPPIPKTGIFGTEGLPMWDDLSAALIFLMEVVGVAVLGLALAWALLSRRRRDGAVKPSAVALKPAPAAVGPEGHDIGRI